MTTAPQTPPLQTTVTRFAPSPTGRLHLGHAYSALFAQRTAQEADGRFLLRIEDIDPERCKPEFTDGIFEDLAWLGLTWEEPVRRQSLHFDLYESALARLAEMALLYPCFCSRREILQEIAGAASAPHGPEGALYPGTCRHLSAPQRADKMADGIPYALRLDCEKALAAARDKAGDGALRWHDGFKGWQTATPLILGDAVLGRKDIPGSYHLCVTLDDDLQGITCVTRGEDLFYATHLHVLLQILLDMKTPAYRHHPLILGPDGKRLAKRRSGETIQELRERGQTPGEIRERLGI